jgi:hypothetical protein
MPRVTLWCSPHWINFLAGEFFSPSQSGSRDFVAPLVDLPDMFIEGGIDFCHSLLRIAILWRPKLLAAFGTSVGEWLTYFPRFGYEHRFIRHFVLRCHRSLLLPIEFDGAGGRGVPFGAEIWKCRSLALTRSLRPRSAIPIDTLSLRPYLILIWLRLVQNSDNNDFAIGM